MSVSEVNLLLKCHPDNREWYIDHHLQILNELVRRNPFTCKIEKRVDALTSNIQWFQQMGPVDHGFQHSFPVKNCYYNIIDIVMYIQQVVQQYPLQYWNDEKFVYDNPIRTPSPQNRIHYLGLENRNASFTG